MRVLATAGHVDHGKSALVRALTGMEPDRYEEERRRGLTLDLGFVWTRLGGDHLAFVDVPGHERFVPTMLAGVGPVPGVLFVVAADQGWQPQSEEHLAVLDALGVRHAVLAVTRSDLADPEPVRADALERLAATSLGKVPQVAVSAVTGAGLDALRTELVRLADALPPPDTEADVRLWLDRAFTVRGHGTVVTGTLGAGTLRVGDRLVTADGSAVLRVRGLQSLHEERTAVAAVARVAVNVHGHGDTALGRGQVLLTPDRWLCTEVADVRVTGEPVADLPRGVTLHIGTAAVPVTVRPLGPDTARLTLRRGLPLRVGDRAVLREPGGTRRPCGVTVLDVRPPRLTRRGAGRARAAELETMTGRPDGAAELRRRKLVRRADLRAMGVPVPGEPVAGDWLADTAHWQTLQDRLARQVLEHARTRPLEPGLPTEAARRRLGLPDRALVDALAAALPQIHARQGRLHTADSLRPALPAPVRTAVDALRRDLARTPFRAPEAGRLAELGLDRRSLAAASAAGALLRIADGIVLLPGADADAAAVLRALPQPFTLSEARRALDTTRRVAVPLLEFLDARGFTERVDDQHRRCRAGAGNGGGRESNPFFHPIVTCDDAENSDK
ncbi:selenocysteine-specific translation elongation factor [Streptomyces capoamus]|uniref:Selenocysteine-specific translation elongation factor n=1 Tax=Streptomyces capoamus TaxID=68183 RepID=A0A919EZ56_9ACTN|nr:SelB C-terminal domain-containing protein [Streptomyces capoamus]GGW15686.1 selenocysteine-specific translation elongation factor [Streptomyces libani subsp. rufus]GHG62344.1 selenocysteine-specific translation elongation factor [Streptomyces capoamus]